MSFLPTEFLSFEERGNSANANAAASAQEGGQRSRSRSGGRTLGPAGSDSSLTSVTTTTAELSSSSSPMESSSSEVSHRRSQGHGSERGQTSAGSHHDVMAGGGGSMPRATHSSSRFAHRQEGLRHRSNPASTASFHGNTSTSDRHQNPTSSNPNPSSNPDPNLSRSRGFARTDNDTGAQERRSWLRRRWDDIVGDPGHQIRGSSSRLHLQTSSPRTSELRDASMREDFAPRPQSRHVHSSPRYDDDDEAPLSPEDVFDDSSDLESTRASSRTSTTSRGSKHSDRHRRGERSSRHRHRQGEIDGDRLSTEEGQRTRTNSEHGSSTSSRRHDMRRKDRNARRPYPYRFDGSEAEHSDWSDNTSVNAEGGGCGCPGIGCCVPHTHTRRPHGRRTAWDTGDLSDGSASVDSAGYRRRRGGGCPVTFGSPFSLCVPHSEQDQHNEKKAASLFSVVATDASGHAGGSTDWNEFVMNPQRTELNAAYADPNAELNYQVLWCILHRGWGICGILMMFFGQLFLIWYYHHSDWVGTRGAMVLTWMVTAACIPIFCHFVMFRVAKLGYVDPVAAKWHQITTSVCLLNSAVFDALFVLANRWRCEGEGLTGEAVLDCSVYLVPTGFLVVTYISRPPRRWIRIGAFFQCLFVAAATTAVNYEDMVGVCIVVAIQIATVIATAMACAFSEEHLLRFFETLAATHCGRQAVAQHQRTIDAITATAVPPQALPRVRAARSIEEAMHEDSATDAAVEICDIADFAHWSTGLLPAHVVLVLHRLFTAFDDGAKRFGVTKVATYADSYTVVLGLRSEATKRSGNSSLGIDSDGYGSYDAQPSRAGGGGGGGGGGGSSMGLTGSTESHSQTPVHDTGRGRHGRNHRRSHSDGTKDSGGGGKGGSDQKASSAAGGSERQPEPISMVSMHARVLVAFAGWQLNDAGPWVQQTERVPAAFYLRAAIATGSLYGGVAGKTHTLRYIVGGPAFESAKAQLAGIGGGAISMDQRTAMAVENWVSDHHRSAAAKRHQAVAAAAQNATANPNAASSRHAICAPPPPVATVGGAMMGAAVAGTRPALPATRTVPSPQQAALAAQPQVRDLRFTAAPPPQHHTPATATALAHHHHHHQFPQPQQQLQQQQQFPTGTVALQPSNPNLNPTLPQQHQQRQGTIADDDDDDQAHEDEDVYMSDDEAAMFDAMLGDDCDFEDDYGDVDDGDDGVHHGNTPPTHPQHGFPPPPSSSDQRPTSQQQQGGSHAAHSTATHSHNKPVDDDDDHDHEDDDESFCMEDMADCEFEDDYGDDDDDCHTPSSAQLSPQTTGGTFVAPQFPGQQQVMHPQLQAGQQHPLVPQIQMTQGHGPSAGLMPQVPQQPTTSTGPMYMMPVAMDPSQLQAQAACSPMLIPYVLQHAAPQHGGSPSPVPEKPVEDDIIGDAYDDDDDDRGGHTEANEDAGRMQRSVPCGELEGPSQQPDDKTAAKQKGADHSRVSRGASTTVEVEPTSKSLVAANGDQTSPQAQNSGGPSPSAGGGEPPQVVGHQLVMFDGMMYLVPVHQNSDGDAGATNNGGEASSQLHQGGLHQQSGSGLQHGGSGNAGGGATGGARSTTALVGDMTAAERLRAFLSVYTPEMAQKDKKTLQKRIRRESEARKARARSERAAQRRAARQRHSKHSIATTGSGGRTTNSGAADTAAAKRRTTHSTLRSQSSATSSQHRPASDGSRSGTGGHHVSAPSSSTSDRKSRGLGSSYMSSTHGPASTAAAVPEDAATVVKHSNKEDGHKVKGKKEREVRGEGQATEGKPGSSSADSPPSGGGALDAPLDATVSQVSALTATDATDATKDSHHSLTGAISAEPSLNVPADSAQLYDDDVGHLEDPLESTGRADLEGAVQKLSPPATGSRDRLCGLTGDDRSFETDVFVPSRSPRVHDANTPRTPKSLNRTLAGRSTAPRSPGRGRSRSPKPHRAEASAATAPSTKLDAANDSAVASAAVSITVSVEGDINHNTSTGEASPSKTRTRARHSRRRSASTHSANDDAGHSHNDTTRPRARSNSNRRENDGPHESPSHAHDDDDDEPLSRPSRHHRHDRHRHRHHGSSRHDRPHRQSRHRDRTDRRPGENALRNTKVPKPTATEVNRYTVMFKSAKVETAARCEAMAEDKAVVPGMTILPVTSFIAVALCSIIEMMIPSRRERFLEKSRLWAIWLFIGMVIIATLIHLFRVFLYNTSPPTPSASGALWALIPGLKRVHLVHRLGRLVAFVLRVPRRIAHAFSRCVTRIRHTIRHTRRRYRNSHHRAAHAHHGQRHALNAEDGFADDAEQPFLQNVDGWHGMDDYSDDYAVATVEESDTCSCPRSTSDPETSFLAPVDRKEDATALALFNGPAFAARLLTKVGTRASAVVTLGSNAVAKRSLEFAIIDNLLCFCAHVIGMVGALGIPETRACHSVLWLGINLVFLPHVSAQLPWWPVHMLWATFIVATLVGGMLFRPEFAEGIYGPVFVAFLLPVQHLIWRRSSRRRFIATYAALRVAKTAASKVAFQECLLWALLPPHAARSTLQKLHTAALAGAVDDLAAPVGYAPRIPTQLTYWPSLVVITGRVSPFSFGPMATGAGAGATASSHFAQTVWRWGALSSLVRNCRERKKRGKHMSPILPPPDFHTAQVESGMDQQSSEEHGHQTRRASAVRHPAVEALRDFSTVEIEAQGRRLDHPYYVDCYDEAHWYDVMRFDDNERKETEISESPGAILRRIQDDRRERQKQRRAGRRGTGGESDGWESPDGRSMSPRRRESGAQQNPKPGLPPLPPSANAQLHMQKRKSSSGRAGSGPPPATAAGVSPSNHPRGAASNAVPLSSDSEQEFPVLAPSMQRQQAAMAVHAHDAKDKKTGQHQPSMVKKHAKAGDDSMSFAAEVKFGSATHGGSGPAFPAGFIAAERTSIELQQQWRRQKMLAAKATTTIQANSNAPPSSASASMSVPLPPQPSRGQVHTANAQAAAARQTAQHQHQPPQQQHQQQQPPPTQNNVVPAPPGPASKTTASPHQSEGIGASTGSLRPEDFCMDDCDFEDDYGDEDDDVAAASKNSTRGQHLPQAPAQVQNTAPRVPLSVPVPIPQVPAVQQQAQAAQQPMMYVAPNVVIPPQALQRNPALPPPPGAGNTSAATVPTTSTATPTLPPPPAPPTAQHQHHHQILGQNAIQSQSAIQSQNAVGGSVRVSTPLLGNRSSSLVSIGDDEIPDIIVDTSAPLISNPDDTDAAADDSTLSFSGSRRLGSGSRPPAVSSSPGAGGAGGRGSRRLSSDLQGQLPPRRESKPRRGSGTASRQSSSPPQPRPLSVTGMRASASAVAIDRADSPSKVRNTSFALPTPGGGRGVNTGGTGGVGGASTSRAASPGLHPAGISQSHARSTALHGGTLQMADFLEFYHDEDGGIVHATAQNNPTQAGAGKDGPQFVRRLSDGAGATAADRAKNPPTGGRSAHHNADADGAGEDEDEDFRGAEDEVDLATAQRLQLLDFFGDEFTVGGPFAVVGGVPVEAAVHDAAHDAVLFARDATTALRAYGTVTLVLTAGGAYSALLGGQLLSYRLLGPAVREAASLLDAAPEATAAFASPAFRRVHQASTLFVKPPAAARQHSCVRKATSPAGDDATDCPPPRAVPAQPLPAAASPQVDHQCPTQRAQPQPPSLGGDPSSGGVDGQGTETAAPIVAMEDTTKGAPHMFGLHPVAAEEQEQMLADNRASAVPFEDVQRKERERTAASTSPIPTTRSSHQTGSDHLRNPSSLHSADNIGNVGAVGHADDDAPTTSQTSRRWSVTPPVSSSRLTNRAATGDAVESGGLENTSSPFAALQANDDDDPEEEEFGAKPFLPLTPRSNEQRLTPTPGVVLDDGGLSGRRGASLSVGRGAGKRRLDDDDDEEDGVRNDDAEAFAAVHPGAKPPCGAFGGPRVMSSQEAAERVRRVEAEGDETFRPPLRWRIRGGGVVMVSAIKQEEE